MLSTAFEAITPGFVAGAPYDAKFSS